MEPRIRFATSQDGTRIAFWVAGSGYPIILLPSPTASHIGKEWNSPANRAWFDALARDFTVIRYDGRGLGLSDSDVTDLSMRSAVQDLDAVIEHMGLRHFALFAGAAAGPVAIAYSAASEGATHLILWHAVARGRDFFDTQEQRTLRALAKANWQMFALTAASAFGGWTSIDSPRDLAAILETAGPDFYFRMIDAQQNYDATGEIALVKAKTLVLHRHDYNEVDLAHSRFLASHISDARLEILDGDSGMYFRDDSVVAAIKAFVSEDAASTWLASASEIDNQSSVGMLTTREAQILKLVASGLGNGEVAVRLGISVHTVERHLANVYEKWGVHSRVELILQLINHPKLTLPDKKAAG